jgi:hypothetical protein
MLITLVGLMLLNAVLLESAKGQLWSLCVAADERSLGRDQPRGCSAGVRIQAINHRIPCAGAPYEGAANERAFLITRLNSGAI